MTDDEKRVLEKRLWESRKRAEELGVFDELKKIHQKIRRDQRKRQIEMRKRSK